MAGAERPAQRRPTIVEGSAKVTSGQTVKAVEVQLMEATPDVFALFCSPPGLCRVIAILIMLAGILAIRTLPVRNILTLHRRPLKFQPLILVLCRNAGEQRDSGYRATTHWAYNLLYFSSTSSSDGSVSINVPLNKVPIQILHRFRCRIKFRGGVAPTQRSAANGCYGGEIKSNFLLIAAVYDTTDKASSSISPTGWLVTFRTRWRVLKVWESASLWRGIRYAHLA